MNKEKTENELRVVNCVITYSSSIIRSVVEGCHLEGSKVTRSRIIDSKIVESKVHDSKLLRVDVINSTVMNASLSHVTIKNGRILGPDDYYILYPVGRNHRTVVAYKSVDNLILCSAGCFLGTLDELKLRVDKEYIVDDPFGQDYYNFIHNARTLLTSFNQMP